MKTLRSGAISVQPVVEIDRIPFDGTSFYLQATRETIERGKDWLDGRFIDAVTGDLIRTVQSFVIQTSNHNILVDPCSGNHKRRPGKEWQHNLSTPYLRNLAAAGFRPQDIDVVLCTHLHSDHVGWNTTLANGQWVPTFPKAKYLFCAEDFDPLNRLQLTAPARPVGDGAFLDSLLPIVDARQAMLIEMDHVVEGREGDGVWLEPMPGHSPGHVGVHVQSGAFHVVLIGDVLHHPIQLSEPSLVADSDQDASGAASTRRRVLETYADTNTIIVPAHFPAPTAGRVVGWGDGYRFRWIDR